MFWKSAGEVQVMGRKLNRRVHTAHLAKKIAMFTDKIDPILFTGPGVFAALIFFGILLGLWDHSGIIGLYVPL